MSRPLRIEYEGALYHVMNRGWNRCPIFNDVGDRFLLLKTIGEAVRSRKIIIHAYALMPNHYHFLIETPHANISRAMQHIDGVYTQRFNRKYNRDGSLFRGRFKSILVEKETYFTELVRYIHMNSTKAGLVTSPEKDSFSSHKAYLEPNKAPEWLTTSAVLSLFHENETMARTQLDRFVKEGRSDEVDKIFSKSHWPAILGQENFRKWVRKNFVENKEKPIDVPQDRDIRKKFNPEEVIREVACIYGVTENSILNRSSSKKNEARQTAIMMLRDYSLLPYSKIGEMLGGVSYGGVATLCRRGRNKKTSLILKIEQRLDGCIKYQL